MKVALHILRKVIEREDDNSKPNKNYFSIEVYNRLAAYGMNYFNGKRFIDDIPYQEDESSYSGKMTLEVEQFETLEKSGISDFRFKAFRLNGFRMFPVKDKYWGLDLDNGKPCSLFLAGNNGSGKTSLYSGMEYCCTGKISAADARCIHRENYDDYIGYAKNKGCTHLELMLVNKDVASSKDTFNGLNELLPAFFCSEHEINAFCNDANELTNFFYQQVGYGNLVKIKRSLEEDLKTANEFKTDNNIFNVNAVLSNEEQIRILEGVQMDVFDLIETSALLAGALKKDMSSYIESLKGDKNELDKYWERPNYVKYADVIIQKLQKECDELNEFISPRSQLIKLYQEFIDAINSVKSSDIPPIDGYIPKGYRRREQRFKMKLVDYKKFIAQKDFILDYYLMIFLTIKDGMENESIIASIRKIENDINVLRKHADSIQESPELVSKRYKAHAAYLPSLIEGIGEELKNLRLGIIETVRKLDSQVLQDFLNPKYEKLVFEEIGEKIVPTVHFKDENGKEITFEPKEYFNSFRYKFYCVLLKITMAFTVKKYFNLNFPLVFDDIFYSSDFANRDKVDEFISSIYQIHNKIFKEDESPLQIIFFTHDDLILEAAVNGTSGIDNIICGRLFSYSECNEDSDYKEKENFGFYNLYIPFIND